MIIQCKNCERKFAVKDSDIPAKGRSVRCGYCSVTWHQLPASKNIAKTKKISSRQPEVKENEALSVDHKIGGIISLTFPKSSISSQK